jgi:translation initiation factor 2-alpha kinase 4
MMGNARVLAKSTSSTLVQRSYSFGAVFRDKPSGGHPHTFGEVHFDVVTADVSDLALKEAEAIKVLDEVVGTFPSLSSAQMCFHIGHSELLRHIFNFCGVEPAARRNVADTLSKLNIRNVTWQKIKSELRSAGVSATTVDELQKFDFRGKWLSKQTPNMPLSDA